MLARLRARATRPVDPASAAVFRILFGLLAAIAALRVLASGWVAPLYLEPAHHFTYLGLGWVQPWPGWGMHAHFALLAALGACIALGWRYRLAIGIYLVAFTYVELLDRTLYLNHYYWISVAALVMLVLPLERAWSLDARRRGTGAPAGIPAWTIWSLRGLVGMVYVFAALAKLNPDWLLRGQPLAIWLPHDADLPVIGGLLGAAWVPLAASWATVAFELAVVPALLWRRTRLPAYVCLVIFHAGTWLVLPEIGMFPLIMVAGALVFFPPGWPRTALARVRLPAPGPVSPLALGPRGALDRLAPWLVAAVALTQVLVPFRHLVYPGDVRWTEEGYRLSWRVMLTEKVGHARFVVVDPASGERWSVAPERYLTAPQARAMAVQPDMIREAAQLVRDDFAARGVVAPRVYADVHVAMNGRPPRRLIDPDVDLAAVGAGLGTRSWVLRG